MHIRFFWFKAGRKYLNRDRVDFFRYDPILCSPLTQIFLDVLEFALDFMIFFCELSVFSVQGTVNAQSMEQEN